ncbi:hypothetical protein [Bacillus mesophilum]|uniref:Uncharacterized protein n=1 Tax=Bacillus mesophilum TaxID=1071718 RepID=A0A7V7UWX5_9BACI|nr:hypothetical protein [Bacillus mesophilum]KAB2334389.1 hypothetical protein F7732_08635 [Bacillus mesophilum]PMC37199.1 hypothetical protein CJ195_13805 [Bacillus sp. UMB0899]
MKLKETVDSILVRIGIKHKNVGWTTFAPLKIQPEYTNIDLEKGQVTGVVKYNNKIYLTVIVDVPNNKSMVRGSLRGIGKLTKPFKKKNYIEIIKDQAEFFIENKIPNPK